MYTVHCTLYTVHCTVEFWNDKYFRQFYQIHKIPLVALNKNNYQNKGNKDKNQNSCDNELLCFYICRYTCIPHLSNLAYFFAGTIIDTLVSLDTTKASEPVIIFSIKSDNMEKTTMPM